jgi:hypothetical protein
MADRLVDVDIDGIKAETEKAWCITVGKVTAWVPKSMVKYNPDDGVFTMPEWLALEKELI